MDEVLLAAQTVRTKGPEVLPVLELCGGLHDKAWGSLAGRR